MESMWYYIQTTPGFRILSPEQEKWNNLSVSYRFQQCQNDYVNLFKVCGFYFKAQKIELMLPPKKEHLLWTVMVCIALDLHCEEKQPPKSIQESSWEVFPCEYVAGAYSDYSERQWLTYCK